MSYHQPDLEYGSWKFECPRQDEIITFEEGMGWEHCPYCGASLW